MSKKIEEPKYSSNYNYNNDNSSFYSSYSRRESDVSESSVSDDDVLTKPFKIKGDRM